MANRKTIHARDQEWASFSTSAEQVGRHDWLPDIPLTVITRGKRVWPHNNFGDESEKVWSLLQSDLTDLTDDAIQVIAGNSGHLVHLDEPDLVIRNIKNTVVKAVAGKGQITMLAGYEDPVPDSHPAIYMYSPITAYNITGFASVTAAGNIRYRAYTVSFPY